MDENLDEIEEERKEIEIITGDDSELDISNVYDHLNLDKVRNTPNKQNIIIPGVKKENDGNQVDQEEESQDKHVEDNNDSNN